MFIYLLQHRKPYFCPTKFHLFAISKLSVFAQWKREIWEKKKQSAILCLIKTNKTKFWNVIGYHQPDLSTYNIHEKITRVWLAENGCIFHVTRVQRFNTSANYE